MVKNLEKLFARDIISFNGMVFGGKIKKGEELSSAFDTVEVKGILVGNKNYLNNIVIKKINFKGSNEKFTNYILKKSKNYVSDYYSSGKYLIII